LEKYSRKQTSEEYLVLLESRLGHKPQETAMAA
jgi:hypothetical protein